MARSDHHRYWITRGTYYAYGEGLVKILSPALGIRVAMLPTDGPSENIELIESGEAQIG